MYVCMYEFCFCLLYQRAVVACLNINIYKRYICVCIVYRDCHLYTGGCGLRGGGGDSCEKIGKEFYREKHLIDNCCDK